MASTRRNKATCDYLFTWLRANLGRNALAALTGTDMRALAAAGHILELRAMCGCDEERLALNAFRDVVLCMQPSNRELAFHAIACFGEWHHRVEVWYDAGLPPIHRPSRCKGER
jgi:hypothetical protein